MTNTEIALGVIRVAAKEGIDLSVHDSGGLVISYVEGREPSARCWQSLSVNVARI